MRASRAIVPIMMTAALTLAACDRGREPSVAEEAVAAAARGIDRASSERTLNRLEQLRLALDRYAADNSGYPAGSSLAAIAGDLSPYLKPLQETDAWGNVMSYSSDGRSYTVVSGGPDGRAGTEDDYVLNDGSISPGAR
jgi:hypothetical protein